MDQTFYCSHQRSKVVWCLKTIMSSAIALVVLPLLLQSARATFPPVSNPPPIPSQGVRTVDYERFYFDDLPSNQPSNVIKDEEYFPVDKLDPKLFAPENQSGETGGYGNGETFERYYSEGETFIGPVATPLPDDTYVAQGSVTSKVLPDGPTNVGSSDIWVLTKGPDNQFVRERWIQVPMTQDRVVEVVNQDIPPKQYAQSVKSFPPVVQPPPIPAAPVKGTVAAPPGVVQQVWIRAPPPIQSPKFIQNPPTIVEEIPPSAKQVVNLPPPAIKQYIQPQMVKEAQPLPPPPPPPPATVTKKGSSFIVPPPPPPPLKVADYPSPKQTIVFNQPPVPVDQVVVDKSAPPPQLKHIWIPTSQNTGKFITVPVGTGIDSGKSVPSKGVPLNVAPPPSPLAVSDTWILKQDGPIPRFEQQKAIGPVAPVIQKGSVIVDSGPKLQFDSPKNPPLVGKSIDTPVPVDMWPAKNPIPQQKFFISAPPPPPAVVALPPPPVKSDTVVVGKSAPVAPPPKGVITSVKGLPQLPPPPPPVVVPAPQVIKGKPCPVPVVQAKSQFSPKSVPVPVPAPVSVPVPSYRTIAVNRQPFGRILRINRYPFGPYYVLNPRTSANFYTYPRAPIAPVIQQTKTGQIVRLVPARQLAVPIAPRQVAVPVSPKQMAVNVPRKQIIVPVSNGKSSSPVLLYPPANRLRYSYPWGSYIRSLPVAGKSIFVLPSNNKPAKIKEEKSSSSESSSSESSSSESKSAEKKAKSKEEKKSSESEEEEVAESIGSSIESEEPEPENPPESIVEEVEEEETAASEALPEEAAAPMEEEPEVKDESFAAEESQVKPQLLNRGYKEVNVNSFDPLTKPFYYGFEHRGVSGRKEASDSDGKKVIGSYNYRKPDGLFKNVAYVVDANGSRAHVVSNEPGTVSYQTVNTNYKHSANPENTTIRERDIETDASHENLTEDPRRD